MTDFEKTIHEITALIIQRDERIRELESQLAALQAKPGPAPQPEPQRRDALPEDFPGVIGWVRDSEDEVWLETLIIGYSAHALPWIARNKHGYFEGYRYAQVPTDYERPMTVEELEQRLRKLGAVKLSFTDSYTWQVTGLTDLGLYNYAWTAVAAPTIVEALKAAEAGKGQQ